MGGRQWGDNDRREEGCRIGKGWRFRRGRMGGEFRRGPREGGGGDFEGGQRRGAGMGEKRTSERWRRGGGGDEDGGLRRGREGGRAEERSGGNELRGK